MSTTLDLESFELKSGGHSSREAGMCLMEAVAWFNNEPHSASPLCACPVLTSFGISLNDRMPDAERQKLKPLIPKLVGTRNPALARRRADFLVDRALRLFVPIALRAAGDAMEKAKIEEHALKLRAAAKSMEELPEYHYEDEAVRLACISMAQSCRDTARAARTASSS
jgi:hypothetical protein